MLGGGGGTVDIDELRSLADGLEEEVQCAGCVSVVGTGEDERMQSRLAETSLPEWSGSSKVVSEIILSRLRLTYLTQHV